jgi:hypothetical protein
VRRIVETVFLNRGELFAASVLSDSTTTPTSTEFIRGIARKDWNSDPDDSSNAVRDVALSACIKALREPAEEVQAYLRSLSDSYTLYAFLRLTPDVQSAVVKMFSSGSIWLDTNVLLPVIAEELVDMHDQHFTTLLGAARECGLNLFVTDGVVEELVGHMNRALSCARNRKQPWEGNIPFLYGVYIASGRERGEFANWLESYRGETLP